VEPDTDFLWWLGRFLGTWQTDTGTYEIRRADNGWPESRELSRDVPVPLDTVLRDGRQTAIAGPLGPSPVVLSVPLMRLWLNADDMKNLRGAWNVSAGQQVILERILQRMAALDDSEQKRRWAMWWASHGSSQPAMQNETCLQELRRKYLSEEARDGDRSV